MEALSRKDYFAAAAMQGLLAGRNPNAQAYSTAEIARVAAECATYMVLALEPVVAPAPVAAPPAPPAPIAPVAPVVQQPQVAASVSIPLEALNNDSTTPIIH